MFTDEELNEIYQAVGDAKQYHVGKQLWDGVYKHPSETYEQWCKKKADLEHRRYLINNIRQKIRDCRKVKTK